MKRIITGFSLAFAFLFFTALILIFLSNASYAECYDCGSGMAVENICPSPQKQTYENFYYDGSTSSCTIIDCSENFECNRNGPVIRKCINLECSYTEDPGYCPDPADCSPVYPICAYSDAEKRSIGWGWWLLDYIPSESDGTGHGYKCTDDHDNDCDGTCDATGCCTNSSFKTQASCEADGNGVSFCHITLGTDETSCLNRGGIWIKINNQVVCKSTFSDFQNQIACNSQSNYVWREIKNTWMAPDTDCSPDGDKLKFWDNVNNRFVASIGSNGVMHIIGQIHENDGSDPPNNGDDFVIKDSSGNTLIVIERETGNLWTAFKIYDEQYGGITPTSGDDLIIKNSLGEIVALFDDQGNVYLKGLLLANIAHIP